MILLLLLFTVNTVITGGIFDLCLSPVPVYGYYGRGT